MSVRSKTSQMEYITQEITYLDDTVKIMLGKLVYKESPNAVKQCSDGVRIHLNVLSEDFIKKLYTFIENQVNLL